MIQTVALAAFQVANTIIVRVAITFPIPTLVGACAAIWSCTSISTSCKNQTGNEFHPLTASQVFSMRFQSGHTIRKYKKMAGQNTFQILLLNDANMIGEH